MSLTGRNIRSCDGFTLVELIAVIAIAGVLMAIAILGIQNIVRHNAAEELISELHLAHMSAIRLHRPVTVTFFPNTSQCSIDVGGIATKTIDLGRSGEQFVFDNAPPGAVPPPPDNAFIFSPLGFISTDPGGNVAGNIYLTNTENTRQFQIQTTIAGGIDLFRYDPVGNVWHNAY